MINLCPKSRFLSLPLWPFFFLLLALASTVALGQNQPPAQAANADKKSPAALRGWLLPGKEKKNLALRLRSASGESAPVTLASSVAGAPDLPQSYNALPAGLYVLELLAGDSILSSSEAELRSGMSQTLICLPAGEGKLEFKLFNDGPRPLPPGERTLRVINFAAGREARLDIEGTSQLSVGGNSVKEFKLPPKQAAVSVSVLAPDGGAPAQSFVMVDLAQSVSSYLAILPDTKGRLRPRALPGAPPPPAAAPLPTEPIVEVTPQQLRSQRIGRLELELDSKLARLAVLEASAKGPNKAENAAALKQVLEQKVAELQKELSRVRASNKAAEAAPVPANSDQRPPN